MHESVLKPSVLPSGTSWPAEGQWSPPRTTSHDITILAWTRTTSSSSSRACYQPWTTKARSSWRTKESSPWPLVSPLGICDFWLHSQCCFVEFVCFKRVFSVSVFQMGTVVFIELWGARASWMTWSGGGLKMSMCTVWITSWSKWQTPLLLVSVWRRERTVELRLATPPTLFVYSCLFLCFRVSAALSKHISNMS